jgi:hypothetical protein
MMLCSETGCISLSFPQKKNTRAVVFACVFSVSLPESFRAVGAFSVGADFVRLFRVLSNGDPFA